MLYWGGTQVSIQVCAGINTYFDGVQCHKEDLEYTKRCSKSMEALVKQIECLHNRIPATMGVNRTTIEGSMAAVKAELSLLDNFVGEITGSNSSFSRSTIERMKDRQRKFLFPFRKDHLYRLNNRLEIANGALQSALQLAGL